MKQPSTSLATSGNALALAIANPGALGTIDAYISAVNRLPVLSAERETELGRRLRDSEDLGAARELVLSHLRLVVSVARQYLGYGLPHADLIQEGNVGLMKAVKRFDPERGVRLVSFAVHWIKAEIHEYIIRNWRLVKVATTKAQRKLFFNLRSMRPDGQTLDPEQVDHIARELNVRREDVSEMEVRLSGRDMSVSYTHLRIAGVTAADLRNLRKRIDLLTQRLRALFSCRRDHRGGMNACIRRCPMDAERPAKFAKKHHNN